MHSRSSREGARGPGRLRVGLNDMKRNEWARLLLLAGALLGCNSKDDGATTDALCPVVVTDESCDKTKEAFVFVHGTYGSGDNIANIAQLFGSNGYCQDRFVAVEYNSLGGNPQECTAGTECETLDELIDRVRADTGLDKVVLAGHSQGTSHCVSYLGDPAHAAKVSHYINISGTGHVPNDVDTLSISSMNDIGDMTHHNPNATVTHTFDTADHFTLAASSESFAVIWKYLYGEDPQYTTVQCGDAMVTLEGVAETFGTNTRQTHGHIDVFEVSDEPRDRGEPVMTIAADSEGVIAPFQLKRNVAYEFIAYENDVLVGHAYFPPFKRSNRLLRFLAPPDSAIVAATTTDNVTIDPAHSAVVFRYIGGSFRPDYGHSLKLDGNEVLTDSNTPDPNGTVGMFMYDVENDQASSLAVDFTAPFVCGVDVYIPSTDPAMIEITWNGQTMKVPNWPSDEGLISVMLPSE